MKATAGIKVTWTRLRFETVQAEASGRWMTKILDRHTAILHFPISSALTEASTGLLSPPAKRLSPGAPGCTRCGSGRGAEQADLRWPGQARFTGWWWWYVE
ncbi:unnamed protein product [Ectocarpus sp. 12 AP-2014]